MQAELDFNREKYDKMKIVLFACWFFYMFVVVSGYLLREKGAPFNAFARQMLEPSC